MRDDGILIVGGGLDVWRSGLIWAKLLADGYETWENAIRLPVVMDPECGVGNPPIVVKLTKEAK